MTGDRNIPPDRDQCGYLETGAQQPAPYQEDQWGYGYDSLLTDLDRWAESPWVTVGSIGTSVQHRALWQLTITDPTPSPTPRHTVFIFARTHPNEVQGWWATNEMINFLLSDDPYGQVLRSHTVFHIIPMYNPDGVELGYRRQNANGIDLESNWEAYKVEPEVAALRKRFVQLMASAAPVEIVLNMHAAPDCIRYFICHHASATSIANFERERQFVDGIRAYFPNGIEPWYTSVSWSTGISFLCPESWFWLNHGENVIAMCYEDMNCTGAGDYDSTAYAILHGIGDFLGLPLEPETIDPPLPTSLVLQQNFPNPFNSATTITYVLDEDSYVQLIIYDLLGKNVGTLLKDEYRTAGFHTIAWYPVEMPSGMYIYHLRTESGEAFRKCILLK